MKTSSELAKDRRTASAKAAALRLLATLAAPK